MNGGRGPAFLGLVVAGVVLAAVGFGFLLTGSPRDERARRLDQARVTDLEALRDAIATDYERTGAFPASLEELARRSPLPLRMTDPVGGRTYGYEVIDGKGFRLCAVFDFATTDDDARGTLQAWAHRAGRQCFRFELRAGGTRHPRVPITPVLEAGPEPGP